MPGKARRRRGKFTPEARRRKTGSSQPIKSTQPSAVAKESVSSVSVPAPEVKTPRVKTAVSYPYIATELRTIGILTAIMLMILIVLALVLS